MNPINIIMKVAKIEDHLSDKEMNDILKEHKDSYNIYRRILLIKMVKNGDTIKNASEKLAKDGLKNIMRKELMDYCQIIVIVD